MIKKVKQLVRFVCVLAISCNRNRYYRRQPTVYVLDCHLVCHRRQVVADASDVPVRVLRRMLEPTAIVAVRVIAWFEQR